MIRARLRGLRGEERGYTLIEMVVVLAILGIVITSLTTVFVTGSNAELDMNRRFQAQQQARQALGRIRGDIHCASAARASVGTTDAINGYQALRLNTTNCHGSVATYDYWCVVPVTTTPVRYALYRSESGAAPTTSTCTATDTARLKVADYLISNAAFTTPTIPQFGLETVNVIFKVSVAPLAKARDVYTLSDSIVARNYVYDSVTPIKYCNSSSGCAVPTVP